MMSSALKLLLLLVGVNAVPILAYDVFKRRFAWPIDLGRRAPDGRHWLGPSKTFRGAALALAAGVLLAVLMGLPARLGLLMAAWTVAGDCLSSFLKRRLGRRSGSEVLLLDQLPEALLPLLAVRRTCGLTVEDMVLIVLAFVAVDYLASRFLFKLHLRKHPY
jgi:CDP-2,3-bis-(O-geranylgeranyl)-sn-glycerol synthase